MRVLLVKLSSMGDLIQGLPAITDAMQVYPDLQLDWAIDEAFAEIAHWHPAVKKVITSAHRRWKKDPLGYWKNGEIKAFLGDLRAEEYPKIIDGQSNLKGGVVTALSRGNKYGPDSRSVREWGAHLAYGTRFSIDKNMLAITRLRLLFANTLGYEMPDTAPDFGLQNTQWPEVDSQYTDQPYMVFVHNASWPTKYWVEKNWRELIHRAHSRGLRVLLPWGSEEERQSAEKIASGLSNATVLPRFGLSEQASILRGATASICVDTGLAHMSAAMGTPTVTLYGPTDPRLIGATGPRASHICAAEFHPENFGKPTKEQIRSGVDKAQSLQAISPAAVWDEVWDLVDKG